MKLELKERLVDSLESEIDFHQNTCEYATFCDDRCCQILDDLKTILELLKNKPFSFERFCQELIF